VSLLQERKLQLFFDGIKGNYSDMGYSLYLGLLYSITGKSIFIARILKALYGAYTCVLIYKLAKRNFGEETGRMAGIFCMLMPNLILYTGLHLKEVEMLFLTVAFIERADKLLRGKKYTFSTLVLPVLLAASLFFFRTVLGATAVFALFSTLILSSDKVLGMGKRMLLIIWVVVAAGYFIGGKIATEVESVWNERAQNQQKSLDFRTNREGGNKFSKYAGGAVFAPMIFVIPFPTVVDTPNQQNQQLINGGNYVKNIMAFFTLFALILIIQTKRWREHLLIGSFTIGYLIVIAMSAFAQSERFHQPALPFIMILAAYGVSEITKKTKKYFTWWMVLIFVAIVGWSWFKLAGRGLA
jgi:4-amino-4-deoxy-L-arabinose transferase-like glycosyltransferase